MALFESHKVPTSIDCVQALVIFGSWNSSSVYSGKALPFYVSVVARPFFPLPYPFPQAGRGDRLRRCVHRIADKGEGVPMRCIDAYALKGKGLFVGGRSAFAQKSV